MHVLWCLLLLYYLLTVGGQQNVQGAISVLVKYTAMVQEHVHQVLPVAAAVAAHSGWHFCLAAHALSGTVHTVLGLLHVDAVYCAFVSIREHEERQGVTKVVYCTF